MIRFENKDCLELLRELPDGSVDLMLQDPPYGTTPVEWDKAPFLPLMWAEWERVLKPNGAWIFTASQPFTSSLIMSRLGFFKYEMIWEKSKCGIPLNAKLMPMKKHENVLVFYRQQPTYNPQMNVGTPYKRNWKRPKHSQNNHKVGIDEVIKNNEGERYPGTILSFQQKWRRQDQVHPTQKPVELMQYLIKTFTNEGDTVFDGYAGSGTTAIACIKEKRKFIGAELNAEYYSKAAARIKEESSKLVLF